MPAADDLFRPTVVPDATPEEAAAGPAEDERSEAPAAEVSEGTPEPANRPGAGRRPKKGRTPSGRVRHDEKMTVYVTADELLDLEHARLQVRRSTGLAVDRGRLVREAVAIMLADFDANGDDSELVQRLMQP